MKSSRLGLATHPSSVAFHPLARKEVNAMKQLIKRWRGHQNDAKDNPSRGALAKHRRGGATPARWRDEFDRAFGRMWNDFALEPWNAFAGFGDLAGRDSGWDWNWPPMDMAEDEKSITLRVDVPGLGPEDVDVEVSGNRLTVRGSRQEEHKDDRRGVYRHERRSGSFVRTVTLPSYADGGNVEARYDKGVLTITMPKDPQKGPRRVRVST
jgi:HSP20 family molecular chaperone IbpA